MMPDYLEVCERAARRAGDVLLDHFGRVSARHKGPADLVTDADVASQEVVRKTLLEAFPDHMMVGEEDVSAECPSGRSSPYRWIVDPLDGTTNYVHRVPFFCVSLALEREGTLLAATILNPTSGECFTAAANRGAWLNGDRLRTSPVCTMSEALVAAGFPAAVSADSPDLKIFSELVLTSQSLRRTGSAALNLAYVAAGRFDAGWSCSTKIWDSAAGALLIREAGGIATSLTGESSGTPSGPFVVAATRELHEQLLDVVRRYT